MAKISACRRGGQQAQKHHRQRHDERHQAGEDDDDQFLAEDVAEQPQRERQHARAMGDELDQQHQRRHRYRRSRRHGEVFQVRDDALLLEALIVVVDPHRHGATQRDVQVGGGRHQSWDEAREVRQQDDDEDRGDQRQVVGTLGSDKVGEQTLEPGHEVFEGDLQGTRVLDAEARAHEQGQRGQRERDHDQHREVVGDHLRASRHVAPEGTKYRRRNGSEDHIDGVGDPEFVVQLLHRRAIWDSRDQKSS